MVETGLRGVMRVIRLVPFTEEHVPRALAWERDPRVHQAVYGLDPDTVEERVQARLRSSPDERHFALVNSAGLHVGCAGLYRLPDAVSFSVYVGPEHQHHGYGSGAIRELLAEAARWAPELPVVVHVFADEPGLSELCEEFGLRRVGHEQARYLGELRPVYVMSLPPAAERASRRS